MVRRSQLNQYWPPDLHHHHGAGALLDGDHPHGGAAGHHHLDIIETEGREKRNVCTVKVLNFWTPIILL